MWFWYITQSRLEAADRERIAREDRLARAARASRGKPSARSDTQEQFLLRLRQAVHHV